MIRFWIFKITWEGIRLAGFMAVRLIYLVVGSSLMTLTTTPNQLTDGLEKGLGFLKRFHVPVHEISMMMSIALRFIPILVEETDKIMKAQMARGADFESGKSGAESESHDPTVGAVIYFCFPQSDRSGNGYGSKMLPRWRRKNKDETASVQPERP